MKTLEFLKTIEKIDKSYFTVSDLEKITGLKRESLLIFLTRLVKKELIVRLKKGLYAKSGLQIEEIASQLYQPSYLSFESALSKYGILSQIPYSLMFATTRRTKKEMLAGTKVEYHQLKKELFFGFKKKGNIFIAEPEKAFLDQLYLASKGQTLLNTDELSLSVLNKEQFKKFARAYPTTVQKLANKLLL